MLKRPGVSFHIAGFSLVEVIVASLLLAIITAGILSVSLSSRNIIKRSHLRHDGYQVAEAVIEGFRRYLGQNYWNDTTSPIRANDVWYCYDLDEADPYLNLSSFYGNTEFALRHNCTWCYKVSNVPGYDYRQIIVNVTWEEDRPQ